MNVHEPRTGPGIRCLRRAREGGRGPARHVSGPRGRAPGSLQRRDVGWCLVIVLASVGLAAAQGTPRLVQPGAPGEPTREISAAEATRLPGSRDSAADVGFMQQMLVHHAQALEMTNLVDARGANAGVRLLARRIARSQADEMDFMREWLARQGASADGHAHHHPGVTMPGMLSPAEMEALAAAHGTAFDRLFLDGMIRHHQGALVMVAELLATEGAAQSSELFAFVSDVDADQRMEIGRMRAMLREVGE
jgi:uncharacterized protein (DUF305 family)